MPDFSNNLQAFRLLSFASHANNDTKQYTRLAHVFMYYYILNSTMTRISHPDLETLVSLYDLFRCGSSESFFLELYGVLPAIMSLILETVVIIGRMSCENSQQEITILASDVLKLEEKICALDIAGGLGEEERTIRHQAVSHEDHQQSRPLSDCHISPPQKLSSFTQTQRRFQRCISKTMHQALVLLFFRQVQPTHPMVLQHYVHSIFEGINEHEQLKEECCIDAGFLMWPTFMAASEAKDASLRQNLVRLLRTATNTQVSHDSNLEKLLEKIWTSKSPGTTNDTPWQGVGSDTGCLGCFF